MRGEREREREGDTSDSNRSGVKSSILRKSRVVVDREGLGLFIYLSFICLSIYKRTTCVDRQLLILYTSTESAGLEITISRLCLSYVSSYRLA